MATPPGGRARFGLLGRPYGVVSSATVASATLTSRAQITAVAYNVRYATALLSANATVTAKANKNAKATLSTNAVITASASNKNAKATLSANATITAKVGKTGRSTLSGNATVTATALNKNARATLSSKAQISATAISFTPVIKPADASPSGRAQITSLPPAKTVLISASLIGRAVITATVSGANGKAVLSSNAFINATANKNGSKSGSATLSGNATVTSIALNKNGRASLINRGVVSVTAARGLSATLITRGVVTAAASNKKAAATLVGNATVTATATGSSAAKFASATLSVRGQITTTASNKTSRANISGNAVITTTAINKNGRSALSGSAVVTTTAGLGNRVYASAVLSCNAVISTNAINKNGKVTLSANGALTATVTRSRTYSLNVTLRCNATILSTAIPPAEDCQCPPWLIDSEVICNWSTPIICISQTDADLPYTLPIFRLRDLTQATYRGYKLESTNVTPYLYTSGPSGVYLNAQHISCLWVYPSTSTYSWNTEQTFSTTYKNTATRSLPYTLPIFRLWALTNVTSAICTYEYDSSLTCTIKNITTLATQTTSEQTLVNSFSRRGCG